MLWFANETPFTANDLYQIVIDYLKYKTCFGSPASTAQKLSAAGEYSDMLNEAVATWTRFPAVPTMVKVKVF